MTVLADSAYPVKDELVKSTVATRGMSSVKVPAPELALKMATSWISGTPALPTPPLVADHLAVADHDPVPPTQKRLRGALKVMEVLPPPSPKPVPAKGIAAPAAVMSLKSTLANETTAAVMVRAVARTDEVTNTL